MVVVEEGGGGGVSQTVPIDSVPSAAVCRPATHCQV